MSDGDATPLSNWLCAEADRLRDRARERRKDIIADGRALLAAKDECRHGEWLPFLSRAGIGERMAQELMKIVRAIDAGEIESATVADLGIRAALQQLRGPKVVRIASPAELHTLQDTANATGDPIVAELWGKRVSLKPISPEASRNRGKMFIGCAWRLGRAIERNRPDLAELGKRLRSSFEVIHKAKIRTLEEGAEKAAAFYLRYPAGPPDVDAEHEAGAVLEAHDVPEWTTALLLSCWTPGHLPEAFWSDFNERG